MARAVCVWILAVAAAALTQAQDLSAWWDVTIDQGTVRGYRSPDAASYYFLGIPYATAPTGPYRFQAPLAAPPWEGILESRYEDILCPQREIGEEQCLVLNVFAPAAARAGAAAAAVPVLVYVHGGAYITGSGLTNGAGNLLGRGVIVVTFNYRLGALGFLCLGTEDAPGNAAMKDQVAALRWVRRNIASFGGDPAAVTVYGTSAGAASVDLLILSNATNGLFQRAILESGSALLPWSVDRDPIRTAKNLAASMGFAGENLTELTEYYKRAPLRVLTAANYDYYNTLTDATFGFAPCLETPSATAFITEDPVSILEKGNYEAVPILIAYCDLEGYFRASDFYEKGWKEQMGLDFSAFLPGDLRFSSEEVKSQVAETVKRFYFGSEEVSEATVQSYFDYFGDTTFFYGIQRSALLHAANSQPVYLMEFSYEGLLNQDKAYFSYVRGAIHADIIRYIFRDFRPSQINDNVALDRATTFWSTFTKNGRPTSPTGSTPLVPVTWTPLERNRTSYLAFGAQLRMRTSPYSQRVQLWDDVYGQHYRPITTVN